MTDSLVSHGKNSGPRNSEVTIEKSTRISIAFFIYASVEPNCSDDRGPLAGRRPELKQPSRPKSIASNAQRLRFLGLRFLGLPFSQLKTNRHLSEFELGSSARRSDGARDVEVLYAASDRLHKTLWRPR